MFFALRLLALCLLVGRLYAATPDSTATVETLPATGVACPAPSGFELEEVASTEAVIRWGLRFQTADVYWRAVGSTTWQTQRVDVMKVQLTGLTNATTYEVKVQRICDGGAVSDFSPSFTFVAACVPPVGFGLSYAGVTAASFVVRRAGPTTAYEISYTGGNKPTQLAYIPPSQWSGGYSLTGLTASTHYRHGIQAICSDGRRSEVKDLNYFGTRFCAVPTNTRILNHGPTYAELNWQGTAGDAYTVRYKARGTADWTVATVREAIYRATGLSSNTAYDWQVSFNCPDGQVLTSELQSFTTINCPVPTGMTEQVVSSTSIRLNWTGISAELGNTYLRYRPVGESTWTVQANMGSGVALQYLTPGRTYEWQLLLMQCQNGSQSEGPVRQFTMPCPTPTELRVNNVRYRDTYLYWSGALDVPCLIQVRPQGTTNWRMLKIKSAAGYTFADSLVHNTAYEWRVTALCSGTVTATSSIGSFTTLDYPAPAELRTERTTKTVATLRWKYENVRPTLRYRIAGTSDWQTASETGYEYQQLQNLTPGTAYDWQVTYTWPGNQVRTSVMASFTTIGCAPADTLSVRFNTATRATLEWPFDTQPEQYELRVRARDESRWRSYTTFEVRSGFYNTVSRTIDSLQTGVAYEAQVVTTCPNAATYLSAMASFTPTCPLPDRVEMLRVGSKTASILWSTYQAEQSHINTVQLRERGNAQWVTYQPTSITAGFGGQLTLDSLTSGVVYEYRVISTCANNQTAATGVQSFSPVCRAPVGAETVGVTSNAAVVRWVSDWDERYVVRWRQVGAAAWVTIPEPGSAGNLSAPNTLTGLTNDTAYEWQVQNSCGSTFTRSLTFVTGCKAPTNLYVTSRGTQSGYVYWSTVGATTRYDLIWQAVGAPTATTVTGLSDNSYISRQLSGLTPGTTYKVQVRAVCADGSSSPLSQSVTFRTDTVACKAPDYSRLETQAKPTSAVLYLNFYNELTNVVQVRRATDTTWRTYPYRFEYHGVARLDTLDYNTAYVWRVVTTCPTGASFVSPLQSFTTNCPQPTSLTTLATTGSSALVSWTGNYDYTYNLRWRAVGTTAWSVRLAAARPFTVPRLAPGTTYEWQVQNSCEGRIDTFSASATFVAGCQQSPTEKWEANVGATSARLYWYMVDDPQVRYTVQVNMLIGQPTVYTLVEVAKDTNYNYYDGFQINGLTGNTAYTWQVRATCADGSQTDWSPAYSFQTRPCQKPQLGTHGGVWATQADFYNYTGDPITVQLRPRGTTTWTNYALGPSRNMIKGLTPSTAYEWQAQATCPPGQTLTSGIDAFTTAACPTPVDIAEVAVEQTVARLRWGWSRETNDGYQVQYRLAGTSVWQTKPVAATATIATIDSLLPNRAYEWRVMNTCAASTTVASGVRSFTTGCNVPTGLNASTGLATSARLNWTVISTTEQAHQVRWRVRGTNNWTTNEATTTRPHTLTGLTINTVYEWQVRKLCDGQATDYSASSTFATGCPRPEIESVELLGRGEASVSLSHPMAGVTYTIAWQSTIAPQAFSLVTPPTTVSGTSAFSLSGIQTGLTYAVSAAALCAANTAPALAYPYPYKLTVPPPTDLSLNMVASTRTPHVGDVLTFSLTVSNTELDSARAVVRNWLPPGLSYVGTDDDGVTATDEGVVLRYAVPANGSQIKAFQVRVDAEGYYVNAAEIVQCSPDADSRPNSGLDDGEDDTAQVDLRTMEPAGPPRLSPRPNARKAAGGR